MKHFDFRQWKRESHHSQNNPSSTNQTISSCASWEVRRRWIEEELHHGGQQGYHRFGDDKHGVGPGAAVSHLASPTTWRDIEPSSPMAPSPNLKRSSSFRDFVVRTGPSYGDLVEQASKEYPWVSTILDCVLFLHNTLALTVYFLFVSESLERISFWPLNDLGEPYSHNLTIVCTAVLGCWLSTWPTVGALARLGEDQVIPFILAAWVPLAFGVGEGFCRISINSGLITAYSCLCWQAVQSKRTQVGKLEPSGVVDHDASWLQGFELGTSSGLMIDLCGDGDRLGVQVSQLMILHEHLWPQMAFWE